MDKASINNIVLFLAAVLPESWLLWSRVKKIICDLNPQPTGVGGFNYVAQQSAGARFLALVMVLLRLRMHGTSSRLNTGTYVKKGYLLTY